jgi:hypothetical protein
MILEYYTLVEQSRQSFSTEEPVKLKEYEGWKEGDIDKERKG